MTERRSLVNDLLLPGWDAPASVGAWITTRALGGAQPAGPLAGFNLATHVGDDAQCVLENRRRLQRALGVERIHWLEQVHGVEVVDGSMAQGKTVQGDALYTNRAGSALAVLTADCLPVFFCDREGREVAVAHAGWRGLAGGILANTVARFDAAPGQLLVWLGPAISQRRFEVGAEVRAAFLASTAFGGRSDQVAQAFAASSRQGHYLCNLYQLARICLRASGVSCVGGGEYCTFGEAARFYSYRREPAGGRMASLIALI